MRLHRRRVLLTVVGIVVLSATAIMSPWPTRGRGAGEERNRDSRPDLSRLYDGDGQVASVTVDTNFDGRSDVREFYENGALVRRELDRDFNNQIDLVQEFDPSTREIVRSITDVDADGVADLLLLFQDGRPVYSKWATAAAHRRSSTLARPTTQRTLVGLADPFADDLTVRSTRTGASFRDAPGLSIPFGLPRQSDESKPLSTLSSAIDISQQPASASSISPVSPRGPPIAQL